jgi:ribosomal protein S18 acetylase RimI-like enzyme
VRTLVLRGRWPALSFRALPVEQPTQRMPLRGTRVQVMAACVGDASDCLALFRQVLREGQWFITEPDEFAGTLAWQRRVLQDFIDRDNCMCFVARRGRNLVGVLTVQGGHLRRMAHVAKLEIFVDDAARGGGVGRMLMHAAVDWAVSHADVSKIGLAVFEDNTRAIAMYTSFGFVVEGRRAGEYREADGSLRSDLLMCLGV